MRAIRNRRGSILLMVVGLLTILGMLGGTFLLVSRLHLKQSESIAVKSQGDPIIAGAVAVMSEILANDLYFDEADPGASPYSGTDSGAAGWKQFIDHPSYSNHNAGDTWGWDDMVPIQIDDWLSSTERRRYLEDSADTTYRWPHVTHICGLDAFTPTDDPVFVPGTSTDNLKGKVNAVDPVAVESVSVIKDGVEEPLDMYTLVDTDGEGESGEASVRDAYLYDAMVMGPEGQKYYVAVRIEDLASRMSVNVAGTPTETVWPTAPVSINLSAHLALAYPDVHEERCGDPGVSLNTFNVECARRLLSPDTTTYQYSLFPIGDEAHLRWLGAGPSSRSGRLYEVTKRNAEGDPLEGWIRRDLTTFSASRLSVRHPSTGPPGTEPFASRIDISSAADLTDNEYRREQLGAELARAGATDAQAAHFVANLWAYVTPYVVAKTKKFEVTVGGVTAYGLINQPVITEVYAYHESSSKTGEPPDETGDDTYKWACAVELMNPSNISISLSTYKIGGASIGSVTIPAASGGKGGKVVLYNFGAGSSAGSVDESNFGDIPLAGTPGWHKVDDLNFFVVGSGDREVVLARTAEGVDIPLDKFNAGSDLGYNHTLIDLNGDPYDDTVTEDRRRDDDLGRGRYSVASYYAGSEKLNEDNGVTTANIPLTTVWEGFEIDVPHEPPMDLGDVLQLYVVGPDSAGGTLPTALKAEYATKVSRGRADPCEPDWIADPPSDYPDVPWPAMLGELLDAVGPAAAPSLENSGGRVYGRINVNTVGQDEITNTVEVLERLPWPTNITVTQADGVVKDCSGVTAVGAVWSILAYRERTTGGQFSPEYGSVIKNYRQPAQNDHTARSKADVDVPGRHITGLRDDPESDIQGFLTPGEVAIPLAQYADKKMMSATGLELAELRQLRDYPRARDTLYRAISNLITVNSDVYSLNIRVQLGRPTQDEEDNNETPQHVWYYVAVIDRGSVRRLGDMPAVLLFTRVK
ncbi:MAG: hypothetical protein QF577_03315 [Phycisphaerae bacterium]|nr:hypothetical protein [Phycisphaerae bacterium]